ncbi:hypothetical protein IV203_035759 [Nitzschia inconspicua]|uniref:F-box domain-containing protein n=1 Tax=Nitzschia inconspicua TaxID=303405 RepID=A0A9K3LEZ3_9STRA|nr:hypothetical protein IV203_035759 [Nitzschia inconspicua]
MHPPVHGNIRPESILIRKKLVGEDTPLYPNLALGRSLHDVISSTREENCISIEAVEAALQTSKIAAEKAHIVSHGLPPIDEASTKPMINAVYHLRYQSKTLQKLSEGIVPFLHDHTSSIGSIVYVVFKGVLVFDRYCGGLTLSKADQERLLNGNQGSRRRSISLGQDPSLLVQSQDQVSSFASMSIPEEVRHYHQQMVTFLPAPVLEYLVMFLGDETAGKLSLVCRNWYNTIGKKSPDLWKKFCIRNKWPTSLESSLSEVTPIMARNQFLSHYSAAKMLRTLALGLRYVGGNKCVELPPDVALCEDSESEMLQVLKVWSPCRILVAQKERCLLDLFDVVDTENGSRRLRRVVRQRVPCDVQTQRTTVIDVDLDDTLVGCVLEGRNEKFFTTFPRQCLLECAGCGKTNELRSKAVTTFNLSSMIQDFCSCNLLEETKLRFDFHEIASIDLQSIDSCHACGEGSFLFQTTLLIAYYQDEAALHADPMSLHALFHLSCLSGSIKCFSFENTGLGVDDRICSDFRRGVDCGNPFEGFVEDPKRSTIATLCTMNSFIQHTHLSPDEQICIAKTDRIQLNFNTDSDYKIILGSEHTMVAERYYCRREHVENEVDPSVERPAIGTLRIFGLALCIPRKWIHGAEIRQCNSTRDSQPFKGAKLELDFWSSKKQEMRGAKKKKKLSKRRSNSGVDGYARGMRMTSSVPQELLTI